MEASKKYVEGFNNGYIFRKHFPELARATLDKLDATDDYGIGLKDGRSEFEKELDREIYRWAGESKAMEDKVTKLEKEKNPKPGREYDDI